MKNFRIDETMFQGAISCESTGSGIKPWRLPFPELALFPPEDGIISRAEMAAGCRLHFSTDSRAISVVFEPMQSECKFDLTMDGELVASKTVPGGQDRVLFDAMPAGDRTVEIWLSQSLPVIVRSLLLDDSASMAIRPDGRKRWVTYGSSITHCNAAHSPARTWPAVAARARNLNLTCLGYGGQCHIDSMVARMIRDREADFISLKLGINVYGSGSLNVRSFKPAIIGSVKIIREKHLTTPIAVVSPIVSPPREGNRNPVNFTLQEMRVHVQDAVRRLQDCGDENLHYVDGLDLFGDEFVADYLPDDLHPNGDGYELMGQRFVEKVIDPIFLSRV